MWPGGLLVAAVIVLVCGATSRRLWKAFSPPATEIARSSSVASAPPRNVVEAVSLGRLTQLAQGSPEQLDAALTEASRFLLVNVERAGNTLHALAKD